MLLNVLTFLLPLSPCTRYISHENDIQHTVIDSSLEKSVFGRVGATERDNHKMIQ